MMSQSCNNLCKTCKVVLPWSLKERYKRYWCSLECYNKNRTRACLICNTSFVGKTIKSVFCSNCVPPSIGTSTHECHGTWSTMLYRCFNSDRAKYENYGGAGITVNPRWFIFENFMADMGPRPKGYTLDRIDNTKGYGPDNCRWVDVNEQRANRRKFKDSKFEYKGVSAHGDKWKSVIKYKSKTYYLGLYSTEKEAVTAYNNKMKEFYPNNYSKYINEWKDNED